MSEWVEWNGGEMPVPKGTMVQLCYRSGDQAICSAGMSSLDLEFKRISGAPYLATRWVHYGDQSDIVKYRIYKEEPKGHPNASILMEIAKEAAVNLEYWKEFEYCGSRSKFESIKEEYDLLYHVGLSNKVQRKPRTIRIGNYDVLEPKAIWCGDYIKNIVNIDCVTKDGAELMLKALQELLGAKQ